MEHIVQEDFEEIKSCWNYDIVVYSVQNFDLQLVDSRNFKLLVSNFFINGHHSQRVDILKFGSYKHAGNSDDVEVRDLLRFRCELEVSVHK